MPNGFSLAIPGPFKIRKYPGSCSVVVLATELVTCGGVDAEDRAAQLCNALNNTWDQKLAYFSQKRLQQPADGQEELKSKVSTI